MKFSSKSKFITLAVLMVFALTAGFIISGCSKDRSSSVTNPNPDPFHPVGTIQGVLVDAATKRPIKGAVIDIGLKQATTTETGQFTLTDVPATDQEPQDVPDNHYIVTIDLRNATEVGGTGHGSGVTSDTGFKYPDFAYDEKEVEFMSLNDTDTGPVDWASEDTDLDEYSNSSNHDTPVDHLVASLELEVGKLSTTLRGVVADCNTLQNASGTWTVELISDACSGISGCNSGSGDSGNVIAEITVGTGAEFVFSDLEAMQSFTIIAHNADQTILGEEDVETPFDGKTKILKIQSNEDWWDTGLDDATVCVESIDDKNPRLTSVEIKPAGVSCTGGPCGSGANIGNVTSADVVYTFSESIKQDAFTSPGNVLSCAITGQTYVNFDGQVFEAASGNMENKYTVAWNSDFTQLTVHIDPLATASIYSVDIDDLIDGTGSGDCVELTDANDNDINTYNSVNNEVVFYTITDCVPGDLTSLAALNQPYDWDTDVDLDWVASSCSKNYNVYRRCDQVWPDKTILGQEMLLDSTGSTAYSDTGVEFIDINSCSNIKLECTYTVKGVGPDLTESATGGSVTVSDTKTPELTSVHVAPGTNSCDDSSFISSGCQVDQYYAYFSEPLDETTAETLVNYAIGSSAFDLSICVTDIAGDGIDGGCSGDDVLNDNGTGMDTCTSGANGVCDSVAIGDDDQTSDPTPTVPTITSAVLECSQGGPYRVLLTLSNTIKANILKEPEINSGADGVCEYTGCSGDAQLIPNGQGKPDAAICVTDGDVDTAGNDIDGGCAPDDVFNENGGGKDTCTSGPNGICDTTKAGNDVQNTTVGFGLANVVCADGGTDFEMNCEPELTSQGGASGVDDTRVDYNFLTISNDKDVAGNVIDSDHDQINTGNVIE